MPKHARILVKQAAFSVQATYSDMHHLFSRPAPPRRGLTAPQASAALLSLPAFALMLKPLLLPAGAVLAVPAFYAFILPCSFGLALLAALFLLVLALYRRNKNLSAEKAHCQAELSQMRKELTAHIAKQASSAAAAKGEPAAAALTMADTLHGTALKAMLNAVEMPLWLRNQEGELLFANKACANLIKARQAAGRAAEKQAGEADLPPAADADIEQLFSPALRRALQEARRAKQNFSGRTNLILKGNRHIFTCRSLYDTASQCFLQQAEDITETLALRGDAARIKQGYAETFDRLSTSVAIFDPSMKLEFFNSAFAALWPLESQFLETKPNHALLLDRLREKGILNERPDWREWKEELFEAYHSLKPQHYIWNLPDGRTLRVVANPHPQGGVTWLFDDSTEKLALQARYNTLIQVQGETLDNLSEGVAVFGADGRLRLANPAFAALWHLPSALAIEETHIESIKNFCQTEQKSQEAMRGEALTGNTNKEARRGEAPTGNTNKAARSAFRRDWEEEQQEAAGSFPNARERHSAEENRMRESDIRQQNRMRESDIRQQNPNARERHSAEENRMRESDIRQQNPMRESGIRQQNPNARERHLAEENRMRESDIRQQNPMRESGAAGVPAGAHEACKENQGARKSNAPTGAETTPAQDSAAADKREKAPAQGLVENAADIWQKLALLITGFADKRDIMRGRTELADKSVYDYMLVPLPQGQTMLSFVNVTDSINIARALHERNAALESADTLRNDFIQHVSYELRTPLTNIMGFTDLLRSAIYGRLEARQAECLADIAAQSELLLNLVNDILDLATVDAGIMELNISAVSVAKAMHYAAERAKAELAQKNITLEEHIADGLSLFQADEARIRQIFVNLLNNAAKAAPEHSHIRFYAEKYENYIAFSVEDEGKGIAKERQAAIFKRFTAYAYEGQKTGIGLGLSIVKSFVELHQGRVFAESSKNGGTKIVCLFPFHASGAAALPESGQAETRRESAGKA